VSRLKFKPVTYFAVIAEHKDRYLGLATTDRAQIGQTEWGTAKRWVLDEHTATQYSHDDDPVALLRLRFLSEAELETLPEAIKQLSQRYQPETTVRGVDAENATVEVITNADAVTDDALTDAHFWEAQQYFHGLLVALSADAARQSKTLEQACVPWQRGSCTDARIQLQAAAASKDGKFSATLVVTLLDAVHFYSMHGTVFTPTLERQQLADSEHMEPFEVQTLRGKFKRLPDGKYTNGTMTYNSLRELSRYHSWRSPAQRPIAETPAASELTEEQFWNVQQTVHQCLLELSEEAVIREASYNVSMITFKHCTQALVRDVQVGHDGHWQATLVVQQPKSLWLYELTGDPDKYHPERLSLAAAIEKRVRRMLDPAKVPMALRAILQGIQQLPTDELRLQALLLLHENTQVYLTRYAQKALLIELAEWLQDLEIVVEPQRVRTTDGFTLERKPDGSYSDGNLTYESLQDLDREHDWEESA
jgi:hypothetical protein